MERDKQAARSRRGINGLRALLATAGLSLSLAVLAHGDVVPQAVDTRELPPLGEDWRLENPYRGNAAAIRIGASGYNQNCAR